MSGIERSLKKMTWELFEIILIISIGLMVQSSACPSPCICKWKGGKQTAECGGHKLINIPDGIDPSTQVLNFSFNALSVLQSERFQKMELINLQKIYLANNELIRINDRAFRGLSNLVELDLSDNMLASIPTETFQDYSSLMRLSLSGNPIRELKTSAFKYLSYLTTLELSNCQISFIEDEAFIGMDNLEWLKLDGNRIRNIRGTHILPQSLNGISLHGNRWTCDCKLIDMYNWLNTYQIPQQQDDPKCFEPLKLQGHVIKTLQVDELACLPEMTPTTFFLEIAEGKNISLECKITAIPEAVISWWFQGQVLQNDTVIAPNLHLYYFIEENISDDSKRSELFIYNANADDNGTFVCMAENSAGRSQANYTIRVIVKEEPIVEEVSFPNELFLFVIAVSIFLLLIVVICCCVIFCKCKRKNKQNSGGGGGNGLKKKKKKRSKGKEVTFQLPNSQKCVAIASDMNNSLVCSKINGNLTITDNNQQDMLLYIGNNAQSISMNDMTVPAVVSCGGGLPSSLSSHDRRNPDPDLINDAESLRQRNEGDMSGRGGLGVVDGGDEMENNRNQALDHHHSSVHKDNNNISLAPILRSIPSRFSTLSTLPRGAIGIGVNNRDMYQVDVHLNPGCFIDSNGYPTATTATDYSLTPLHLSSIPSPSTQMPVTYNYKTLPHNRGGVKLNNSIVRFSNEAEFITRTSQTLTYAPDVRYTAEGYPCVDTTTMMEAHNYPSPPEGFQSDNHHLSSLPTVALLNNQNYCTAMQQQQQELQQQHLLPKWPSCLPGYHPQQQQQQPITIDTQTVRYQMSPLQSPTTAQQSPLGSSLTIKKCVGAQTNDLCENNNVIHEEEEEDEEEEESDANTIKCRQLKGPLADSPDEGYVGDSQESTDM